MTAEFNGFCLCNNVAVAAKNAIDNFGIKRVLIVDFDAHHGQATQRIFYDSSKVRITFFFCLGIVVFLQELCGNEEIESSQRESKVESNLKSSKAHMNTSFNCKDTHTSFWHFCFELLLKDPGVFAPKSNINLGDVLVLTLDLSLSFIAVTLNQTTNTLN